MAYGLKLKTHQDGIATLEILIATVVLTLALTAVILVLFGGMSIATDTQTNQEALYTAQTELETARSQSKGTVADFNSIVTTTATVSGDIYTKQVVVSDISPCSKKVTSNINWALEQRPQSVDLTTILTSVDAAIDAGGDCDPSPPSTDWNNLVCDDHEATWDDSPSLKPTGIDVFKRNSNTYAAITSNSTSDAHGDFYIVNVTNRASLLINPVPRINTGPGLNDVDVAGNYAFVVSDTPDRQFHVIDITDLTSPAEITTASRSLNPIGGMNPEGKKIFYYNNSVYIGTDYMGLGGGHEFQIFDVTDPANPSQNPVGSYQVRHNIYEILVRNETVSGIPKTLAYLALSDSVGDKPKLLVLDVTNPASITQIGSFNPVPNDTLYGTALYVLGKNVYLGRQRATGSSKDVFFLDVNDMNSPSILYSENLSLNNNNEVRDMVVSNNLFLMAISKNKMSDQDTFQAWNIADLNNIQKAKCNYPQDAVSFDFDGNFAYVVNHSQSALRIVYDANNPFQ